MNRNGFFHGNSVSPVPTKKEDMLLLLFSALGCIVSSSIATKGKVMTEKDLRRYLFADYDKLVRPVKDPNNAMIVKTSISLLAITELDEDNHTLVMETWTTMKWKDDYLTWDPNEFNNITILNVPDSEVWKPDLSVYTSSSDDSLFPRSNFLAVIYSDGTVSWIPAFTIKNRCPKQKKQETSYYFCNIRIGSWTYSVNLMDIQLIDELVPLNNFLDTNPNWILINAMTNRESKHAFVADRTHWNLNFLLSIPCGELR
ncbi:acetylcholine receptor subunit alpha-1-B [Trichonephila clavata]|uniref:Acetylcholine receptor subunit alpha-1-B n=1 Tax=Trichonephila clavata TaxID=2740835 RepID=A0A8X6IMR0_TRICU|nr:acetylcholine receptor subunit alpha-1-B [Trichonephila clavata]